MALFARLRPHVRLGLRHDRLEIHSLVITAGHQCRQGEGHQQNSNKIRGFHTALLQRNGLKGVQGLRVQHAKQAYTAPQKTKERLKNVIAGKCGQESKNTSSVGIWQ